tara:strand:- start:534 stop:986 length:453 start_codon:yes stop_codon:yes gene_type:complete
MSGLFVDSIKDKSDTKTLATLSSSAVSLSSDVDIKSAINASGSAPIYACRAWGHISSGGVATNSGNVSGVSLTDTSKYQITFTTNLPTANYAIVLGHLTSNNSIARISNVFIDYGTTPTASGFFVRTMHGPSSGSDASFQAQEFYFAVFE